MSGYTEITLLQYELEKLRAELAEKDEVIAEAGEMLAMRDRQLAELKERRCEEIAKYRDAEMGGDFDSEQVGYWCVVCGRFLRADEFGVIVHDDKPHPESMTFEEPIQ